jgi:hypothetical protein
LKKKVTKINKYHQISIYMVQVGHVPKII